MALPWTWAHHANSELPQQGGNSMQARRLLGALVGCACALVRPAAGSAGAGEVVVLRAGESGALRLTPGVEAGTGKPAYSRVCYQGASALRLGLVWHRAELEFSSAADASLFAFESARDDSRPALLHALASLTLPLSGGGSLAHVERISPFGTSCVGVRALPSARAQAVVVHARRRFVWWLPALCFAGLALLLRAGALSERDSLYYAGGSSLGVLFGVLLVGFFVAHRLLQRRAPRLLASAVLLTGYIGSLYDALGHRAGALAARYYGWALLYAVVCAAVGLVLVHRSVSSASGVPVWWRDVTRWSLWLLGGTLALGSTYSTPHAVGGALLAALAGAALALLPEELRASVWASLFELFEARAAPRPAATFLAGGRFLSADEFAVQGEIETDRALQELHSSPAFQQWLLTNRRRIRLSVDADD